MLQNRRQEERGFNRLPKQSGLPTLKQLQSMLAETLKNMGKTTQLPFGDPPEDYALAVFKDRGKGELHWALYRGDGAASMLVWDQASMDPGHIHQLITAQFPGFDLKPVALRTQSPQTNQAASGNQSIWDGFDNQSMSLKMKGKPTLEGDLKNLQIPNVLQSIGMSKGTGRLEVTCKDENGVVYFADGAPVHCVLGSFEGSIALVELVGWDEGEFRFYPENRIEHHTIKKRLDTLLMEGAALDDQFKAIRARGIKDESFLIRNHPSITEQMFEKLLESGTGADMVLQKQFYQQIDNKSRLTDILRKFQVNKLDWVPIIFNFATCNLVTFVDQLPESRDSQFEVDIDWTQSLSIDRMLTRQDTGLYTYPAFLWMLEREFNRWERFSRPLSVVLLDITTRPQEQGQMPEPLPIAGVREIAERLKKFKRKTDILAHYETFGFALILPETEQISARNLADRLVESLVANPLQGALNSTPLLASAGVASIPEDCISLSGLLGRARARKSGQS